MSNRYDELIFGPLMRKLYASPYFNVGDWSTGASNLADACDVLLDRVIALLPTNVASILDVGCGLGAGTCRLEARDARCQVVGINYSNAQIAYARQVCGASFAVMDGAALAFPDRSFDAIVSVEAAFHFNTRRRFFEEAWRVLDDGGVLILTDMLVHSTNWVGANLIPQANSVAGRAEYARLCQQVGFAVDYLADITRDTWLPYAMYFQEQAHAAGSPLTTQERELAATLGTHLHTVPVTYMIARLTKRA